MTRHSSVRRSVVPSLNSKSKPRSNWRGCSQMSTPSFVRKPRKKWKKTSRSWRTRESRMILSVHLPVISTRAHRLSQIQTRTDVQKLEFRRRLWLSTARCNPTSNSDNVDGARLWDRYRFSAKAPSRRSQVVKYPKSRLNLETFLQASPRTLRMLNFGWWTLSTPFKVKAWRACKTAPNQRANWQVIYPKGISMETNS